MAMSTGSATTPAPMCADARLAATKRSALCRAALALLLVAGCSTPPRTGEAALQLHRWNTRLAAELPAGTSRAEVEAWFARAGLQSGYLPEERVVTAIERDVETSGMVSAGIAFRCPLDAEGKLIACRAQLVFTGP